jgi:hypothetical protein
MWVSYDHFDTSLINKARGHVLEIIMAAEYDVLMQDPARIARTILSSLREDIRGTGIKLVDARLDQFVKTRQYRILGSTHMS